MMLRAALFVAPASALWALLPVVAHGPGDVPAERTTAPSRQQRRRDGATPAADLFLDYMATKYGMADALHAVLVTDGDLRMQTRDRLAQAMARS